MKLLAAALLLVAVLVGLALAGGACELGSDGEVPYPLCQTEKIEIFLPIVGFE